MKHPVQPTEMIDGALRFKANAIVVYLLENGGIDMNRISQLDFSREDREQFAQLIGYSVSGASDLSYVTPETIEIALADRPTSDAEVARELLGRIQLALKPIACELFERHPDDLPTRFVKPAAAPAWPTPVCRVCNDTHVMALESRDVMCTHCPTPCQACRKGGRGPYCEKTPCACPCHGKTVRASSSV